MKYTINLIDSSRIKLMWETDRWDESLEGILKLDGKQICHFKRVHHPSEIEEGLISYDDREYNRYDVFELTAEEIENEIQMHADFQKFVGAHTDAVDGRLTSRSALVKPLAEHKKFYDKYPPTTQKFYKNNKYIGSFYMNRGNFVTPSI